MIFIVIEFIALFITQNIYDVKISSNTKYINTIIEKINNGESEIRMSDIFEFEFEYIYMPSNTDFDTDDLKITLNVNGEITPIHSVEKVLRIIFVYDSEIVYDFGYLTKDIIFEPLNQVIYKEDATFKVTKEKIVYKLSQV